MGDKCENSRRAYLDLRIYLSSPGIGGALNVPGALGLIVEWFPDPDEQKSAINAFGAGGGFGSGTSVAFIALARNYIPPRRVVLGTIIGGIFVQWVTWRWTLWLPGIACLAVAALGIIIIPASAPRAHKPSWRRLDLGAVSFITAALILFIYAVTSGPINGWDSANCLAPLIISIALGIVFFIYEAKVPEDVAALPPQVWRYTNVPVLFGVAFIPFAWFGSRKYSFCLVASATIHS